MVRNRRLSTIVLAVFVLLTLHSCSDDSSTPTGNNETNKPNEKLLNSYYPLSKGSKWVYSINANNTAAKEYTQYNTKDTVINGKKYVEVLFSLNGAKFYTREDNNIIYTLNKDVSENEYKTYDFSGLGAKLEIESSNFLYTTVDKVEFTDKLAYDTVGGKVYKDCIELTLKTYNKSTNGLIQTRYAYFSKGIGLYYYMFFTPDLSQMGDATLKEYTLK